MSWGRRPNLPRPEWPKLLPLPGTFEEAKDLLLTLRHGAPDAEIVDGGGHGIYARCHNRQSETTAKRYGEKRSVDCSRAALGHATR